MRMKRMRMRVQGEKKEEKKNKTENKTQEKKRQKRGEGKPKTKLIRTKGRRREKYLIPLNIINIFSMRNN